MVRVLHLAPHYGGGVGTVMRAFLVDSQRIGGYGHRLACLEAASNGTQAWAAQLGIDLADRLHWNEAALRQLLNEADIVHIHWWHHPLLNAFMYRNDLPPFRCVLWTHVNGHYAPQNFPLGLADYPDVLVLATSWSLQAPTLADAVAQGRDIRVVRSTAGLPTMLPRVERGDAPIRVGYVGTVDPIKMHPDFMQLCLAAELPGPVVVAGGPRHEALRAAAQTIDAADQFEILGPVANVPALMSRLDVLAYPLNPQHYGTGEQVLLEAVAAGVVPVVLGTENERETLELLGCGVMTDTATDFVQTLHQVATDKSYLQQEQMRCGTQVSVGLQLDTMTAAWHQIYVESSDYTPRQHSLNDNSQAALKPHELLLAACRGTSIFDFYQDLMNNRQIKLDVWQAIPQGCFSKTRGSCFHYGTFFDDAVLESVQHTITQTLIHEH
ncbi:Glycosyltransferase involved in cell wall bisynthesis [Allochromatium warmingii]|uniref:Glycosyltransferase involved in cell wall bisynthesis n=1 Tax=Allochromatium warmingii TaxID=61595 RepID=A0A1H3IUP3_ALLWA|nr:glycosyltransferase [Allochromatium warmingii]SDY31483.1 Glycosyltransferase involved in cell wall bisynthesis [Allochromatium warmingii]